jgi:hypothetical protein
MTKFISHKSKNYSTLHNFYKEYICIFQKNKKKGKLADSRAPRVIGSEQGTAATMAVLVGGDVSRRTKHTTSFASTRSIQLAMKCRLSRPLARPAASMADYGGGGSSVRLVPVIATKIEGRTGSLELQRC